MLRKIERISVAKLALHSPGGGGGQSAWKVQRLELVAKLAPYIFWEVGAKCLESSKT